MVRRAVGFEAPKPGAVPGMPYYNVLTFALDVARPSPGEEVKAPGDSITAYSSGTLVGCFIRIDAPTNDPIPLNEFNPYYYPAKFKRFWLQTPVQARKYIRLHVSREGGSETTVSITATAPAPAFYTLRSDKDSHFTGALTTGNKEDENLAGLLGNKIRITNIAIQAKQALDLCLMFWRKDTFANTNLDVDTLIGVVQLDLSSFGKQVGGAGQYYMSIENVDLDYEDEDISSELHVSLYNNDAVAKIAGAAGEVVVFIKYELRA